MDNNAQLEATGRQSAYRTNDIKLAAILISLGIPIRKFDPVTCIVSTENGQDKKTYSFWFLVEADTPNAKKLSEGVAAYERARDWTDFSLDPENPVYWMKGVLENREVLLNWIRKDVPPMRVITHGNKTVMIGERVNRRTREYFKSLLK